MKKAIPVLLALALCLGLLVLPVRASDPTPPTTPAAGDVWDGTAEPPTELVKLNGVTYYKITKCAQLAYVAQTGGDWQTRNYVLANNLILNNVTLKWDEGWNLLTDPAALREWSPVEFSGIFDGGGYTVSGLYVNGYNNAGLFGTGTVKNLKVLNAYVKGKNYVGGVMAYGACTDCVFSGAVIGRAHVGGVVGHSLGCTNCVNYGAVSGSKEVGGVAGFPCHSSYNCVNYGAVSGKTCIGGVAGIGEHTNCANYGAVTGSGDYIGGVVGKGAPAANCVNFGAVTGGGNNIGGVAGYSYYDCPNCVNYGTVSADGHYVGGVVGEGGCVNCCNLGAVSGENIVGGIVGSLADGRSVKSCYNVGTVTCARKTSDHGAIVGSYVADSAENPVSGCYYLQTEGLYGCGGVPSPALEPEGFSAMPEAALRQRATYKGWDFSNVWRIDPERNGGYPYLFWQKETVIPLAGLMLSTTALLLGAGDMAELTVRQTPAAAELPALSWRSDDEAVATVSDSGLVTAVGPGTATVTVSGGGITASCAVAVVPRQSNEYRVGPLELRDAAGSALSAIPSGAFLVTVPITKLADVGNCTVLLAAYTAEGRFRGLTYGFVNGASVGDLVAVTIPVDNANGDVAVLKAFPTASLGNPLPLGGAVSFPA